MSADLVPRVFELFTQAPQSIERPQSGLGLGLALVERLVTLHGGTVSASSEGRGKGSEFTITLPAVAAEAERIAAGPSAAPAAVTGGRRRILVVEDSADARVGVQLLLEQFGHVVDSAADGAEGLAKLDEFRPDVALIDLGLPGMDGYELARAARARPDGRSVRLVAISGYGQAEDRQRALAAGFDLHLAKPVDPTALQELLARL
jgi:CheY-like chemotaxis protein